MKIEINIEKKHLIFFGIFVLLVVGGYTLATNYDLGDPKVFHEAVYTDMIRPHALFTRVLVNASTGGNLFWFLVNSEGTDEAEDNSVALGLDSDRNVVIPHNLAVEGELCDNRDGANCKDVSDIVSDEGNGGINGYVGYNGDNSPITYTDPAHSFGEVSLPLAFNFETANQFCKDTLQDTYAGSYGYTSISGNFNLANYSSSWQSISSSFKILSLTCMHRLPVCVFCMSCGGNWPYSGGNVDAVETYQQSYASNCDGGLMQNRPNTGRNYLCCR